MKLVKLKNLPSKIYDLPVTGAAKWRTICSTPTNISLARFWKARSRYLGQLWRQLRDQAIWHCPSRQLKITFFKSGFFGFRLQNETVGGRRAGHWTRLFCRPRMGALLFRCKTNRKHNILHNILYNGRTCNTQMESSGAKSSPSLLHLAG